MTVIDADSSEARLWKALCEFTLAPHREVSDWPMARGKDYCMVTLVHPALVNKKHLEVDALYARKAAEQARCVEEMLRGAGGASDEASAPADTASALDFAGLAPDDERGLALTRALAAAGRRGEELRLALVDLSGSHLTRLMRANLSKAWQDRAFAGERAVVSLDRKANAHQLLRACRDAWPFYVRSISLMQNTGDNPNLDVALMQEIDLCKQDGQAVTVLRLTEQMAKVGADPFRTGGFSLRLRGRDVVGVGMGDEVLVALRPSAGTKEEIPGEAHVLDTGVSVVWWLGLGLVLGSTVALVGSAYLAKFSPESYKPTKIALDRVVVFIDELLRPKKANTYSSEEM